LTKCRKTGAKKTHTQKRGHGGSWFYSILGIYESCIKELSHESQVDSLYDLWERYWDLYAMVVYYYIKHPDHCIKIVKPSNDDNGGGKLGHARVMRM